MSPVSAARCSSHIAAWPSKLISRVKPSSAATVSNSRPIDVVANVRTSLAIIDRASAYRSVGNPNGAAVRSGRPSRSYRNPAAACTGKRAAASPPGSAALRRCATRRKSGRDAAGEESRRPRSCRRRRSPCRRTRRRRPRVATRRARPARSRRARGGAARRRVVSRSVVGIRARNVLGVRVVRDEQLGRVEPVRRAQILHGGLEGRAGRNVVEIADVLAHEDLAVDDQRDRVLEVAADREHRPRRRQASRPPAAPSRARGAGSPARATWRARPSRRRGARSGVRRSGTRPRSRLRLASASSSSYAIGSLERFALVITSTPGAPAAKSRWCSGVYGSITPSSRLSGAIPGSARRAGASTIGRALDVSSASRVGAQHDQLAGGRRGRAPSARTAAPCGTCARAKRRPCRRSRRRRQGDSRRVP